MTGTPAPTKRKRGRQPGAILPGSFAGWLTTAKVGDVYWTDRDMNGMNAQAQRAGRTIALRRFFAVNDELEAVRLVRVTVTA